MIDKTTATDLDGMRRAADEAEQRRPIFAMLRTRSNGCAPNATNSRRRGMKYQTAMKRYWGYRYDGAD